MGNVGLYEKIQQGDACTRCGRDFRPSDGVVKEGNDEQSRRACHGSCHDAGAARIKFPTGNARVPASFMAKQIEKELQGHREAVARANARTLDLERDLQVAQNEARIERLEGTGRAWLTTLLTSVATGEAVCVSADESPVDYANGTRTNDFRLHDVAVGQLRGHRGGKQGRRRATLQRGGPGPGGGTP